MGQRHFGFAELRHYRFALTGQLYIRCIIGRKPCALLYIQHTRLLTVTRMNGLLHMRHLARFNLLAFQVSALSANRSIEEDSQTLFR